MPAVSVSVASAVTAMLAAANLSQDFTPERSYADWELALERQCDLRVDVVASTADQKEQLAARGKRQFTVPVLIAVRKKFGTESQNDDTGRIVVNEIDALILLVEEIRGLFLRERLTDFTAGVWQNTEILAAPHWDHLHKNRQFTGVVRVTFRADAAI